MNVIERAVVLAQERRDHGVATCPKPCREEDPTARRSSAGRLGGNLKSALAHPERQIILEALEANGWNRQDTARMLGINRTTLYKKMKKYDIEFENSVA